MRTWIALGAGWAAGGYANKYLEGVALFGAAILFGAVFGIALVIYDNVRGQTA